MGPPSPTAALCPLASVSEQAYLGRSTQRKAGVGFLLKPFMAHVHLLVIEWRSLSLLPNLPNFAGQNGRDFLVAFGRQNFLHR